MHARFLTHRDPVVEELTHDGYSSIRWCTGLLTALNSKYGLTVSFSSRLPEDKTLLGDINDISYMVVDDVDIDFFIVSTIACKPEKSIDKLLNDLDKLIDKPFIYLESDYELHELALRSNFISRIKKFPNLLSKLALVISYTDIDSRIKDYLSPIPVANVPRIILDYNKQQYNSRNVDLYVMSTDYLAHYISQLGKPPDSLSIALSYRGKLDKTFVDLNIVKSRKRQVFPINELVYETKNVKCMIPTSEVNRPYPTTKLYECGSCNLLTYFEKPYLDWLDISMDKEFIVEPKKIWEKIKSLSDSYSEDLLSLFHSNLDTFTASNQTTLCYLPNIENYV